ncbi:hypothetical protein ASE23_27605 [Rhizobium sp. Root73]|uniref:ATP-binding protein n=1 Tax=unclassified Rhizobium TaxID=2613769 RepID=UPI00072A459C|nr:MULTISPECIES: hypothetical protein [unclassified Rhizobium]KQY13617.1 hypothetical protein ASD36_26795 [Rhizobium sp. Root1334]KRC06036.1 hypothetical protein ASE23_27605 [Rhizobium sp. Root73]
MGDTPSPQGWKGRKPSGIAFKPAAGKNNLPFASTRIVGRGEFIDLIQNEVGKAPLVSIIGAGGVGKTTAAIAIAEQTLGSFRDGVWLVDFAPLQDPSLVPYVIATATGLAVHSANIQAALCRFLRDRELLLLLDNCEHMTDAIATCVTLIMEQAPGVHFLTTSRAPLRLKGEQVHRLPGLATPPESAGLTAEEAMSYPAIQLFVERATDRLETFALGNADAAVVSEICRSLDGIALAIELAAMRVDVFGLKGLQTQLHNRFRLLSGGRAELERHRTMAATLDWSYSLLAPAEAEILRTVSVFAGIFCAGDASAISEPTDGGTVDILNDLASKSLLSVDGDRENPTYRLLESTRAYCQDKLEAGGENRSVHLRHANYICAALEQAASEWSQQQSREWGAAHGRYLDDLRAALVWTGAEPGCQSLLIRLTAAGTLLWNHFSLTDESRTHFERAIEALTVSEFAGTGVEMNLQLALAGALLYMRGIVPEAREALQRAQEISHQLGDADAHLRCLRLIATYELFGGQHLKGIRTLETFLSIAATKDPSAIPEGETHLGAGEIFVGRLNAVQERVERLYENVSKDFSDKRFARFQYSNSVNVMVVLSQVQWLTGSPAAAARTALTVVKYGREAEHELSLSIALAWVCPVFLWIGDDEACGRYTAMLEEVVEHHGIETWRPIATFCRGALASMRQDAGLKGIEILEQAIGQFWAIGHRARLPYFLGVLAEALARHGRIDEAEVKVREALDLMSTQNEQWCAPELLRIQASVAQAHGRYDTAETILIESKAIADEIGALSWGLRTSNDLARLWQAQSRDEEARLMLQPVYDRFTEGLETRDLVNASQILHALRNKI